MGKALDTLAYFSYNPGGVFSGFRMKGAATFDRKVKKFDQPQPLPVPAAPKAEEADEEARRRMKARRMNKTETIFTNPLGLEGEANIARKMLLGE